MNTLTSPDFETSRNLERPGGTEDEETQIKLVVLANSNLHQLLKYQRSTIEHLGQIVRLPKMPYDERYNFTCGSILTLQTCDVCIPCMHLLSCTTYYMPYIPLYNGGQWILAV